MNGGLRTTAAVKSLPRLMPIDLPSLKWSQRLDLDQRVPPYEGGASPLGHAVKRHRSFLADLYPKVVALTLGDSKTRREAFVAWAFLGTH